MALMVRFLGLQGGPRPRPALRAAFRGSIAASGVARLQLALQTAGGKFVRAGFFPVLCPLAGSDRIRTGTNMRNPTV